MGKVDQMLNPVENVASCLLSGVGTVLSDMKRNILKAGTRFRCPANLHLPLKKPFDPRNYLLMGYQFSAISLIDSPLYRLPKLSILMHQSQRGIDYQLFRVGARMDRNLR